MDKLQRVVYRVANRLKQKIDSRFWQLTNWQETNSLELYPDLLLTLNDKVFRSSLLINKELRNNKFAKTLEIADKEYVLNAAINTILTSGVKVSGGQGVGGLLSIGYIIRSLDLERIVESGTHDGYLTNFISTCSSKDVRVDTFDVAHLTKSILNSERVNTYIGDAFDIHRHLFDSDLSRTLFIFDDRVSHKLRIEQLIDIGARYAIFIDDIAGFGYLNPFASHPTPTVTELLQQDAKTMERAIEDIFHLPNHTFQSIIRDNDSTFVVLKR